jgi:ABC-type multidrug transport system fused ATPase/permease subunit
VGELSGTGVTFLIVLLGAGAMIEMIYHLQLDSASGDAVRFLGDPACTQGLNSWFGSLFVLLTGFGLFEVTRRQFKLASGARFRPRSRKKSNAGRPPDEQRVCIELRDLRKSFGKTEIIRGANLAVTAGERVAIIGPNGAGKSTLFNLISGRFEPTSGEVLLDGQRITA